MNLTSSNCIIHNQWTHLPMPADTISWVSQISWGQGMPPTITFSNHHGHEIRNHLEALVEDHPDLSDDNSDYTPSLDPSDDDDDNDDALLGDNGDDSNSMSSLFYDDNNNDPITITIMLLIPTTSMHPFCAHPCRPVRDPPNECRLRVVLQRRLLHQQMPRQSHPEPKPNIRQAQE